MFEFLKVQVAPPKLTLMTRNRVWALAAASVLVVQGCGSAIDELNFTRRQPATTNIIGTWIPNRQTLDDMRKIGGYTISVHELTLSSNGLFWMTNMPDWWTNGFGSSGKTFDSGGGNWKLNKIEEGLSHWEIDLWFTNSEGKANFVMTEIHLQRQKRPYSIHLYRGDPDEGTAMYFERKEDQALVGKKR